MSINSVLNYSPFLSLPYAGTEEGLASNVFCENLSMLSGIKVGLVDGADLAITLNVSDTGTAGDVLETAAVPATAGTGSGTGMTAKFSVVATGGAGGFGGQAQARVLQIYPGGGSQKVIVHSDQRGTVEIRETDGKRTVTVKDPAGQEVHAGPLDTDADRAAIGQC